MRVFLNHDILRMPPRNRILSLTFGHTRFSTRSTKIDHNHSHNFCAFSSSNIVSNTFKLDGTHAQLLSTFLLPKGVINCFNNHSPQSCWAGAGDNVPLAKFNDFGNLFDMDRFSNAVTTRDLSELRVGFPLHPLWKKCIVVQVQYVPRCFLLVESEKFRGASCECGFWNISVKSIMSSKCWET